MEFHITYHIIEILAIIYVVVSQCQTKQMLIHLAHTITSVNDHLDALISITKQEVEHQEVKEFKEKQATNENK